MLLSIYASPGVLHAAPPSVGGKGVVGLVGEGGAVLVGEVLLSAAHHIYTSPGPAAACHRGCPGPTRS